MFSKIFSQKPSLFEFHRTNDPKNISGTGYVLDGVVFHDGTTVVHWRIKGGSTTTFKRYKDFEKIHMRGHADSGIVWVNNFPELTFTHDYLQNVAENLNQIYHKTSTSNKYIIAKLKQLITMKVKELEDLQNGSKISLTFSGREGKTSLSRTGVSAESLTSAPESYLLSTQA